MVSFFPLALLALASPEAAKPEAPAAIYFVVDGSLTMAEPAGAMSRFEAVRAAIASALAGITPQPPVAIRVFGTLASADPCSDSALLSPFGAPLEVGLGKLASVEPAGSSPLAHAVIQALRDVSALEGPAHLVVITDGGDTCGDFVCGRAAALLKAQPQTELHLVGFGMPRRETQRFAAAGCPIARAETPASLSSLLESIVSQATGLSRFSVRAVEDGRLLEIDARLFEEATGQPFAVARGTAPLVFRVPPRTYSLWVRATTVGGRVEEHWRREVAVHPGRPATVSFDLSPGLLRLRVSDAVSGFSESEIRIFSANQQAVVAAPAHPMQSFRLPPGTYSVVVQEGKPGSPSRRELHLPGVEVRPQAVSDYAVKFESGLLKIKLVPRAIISPFALVQVFRSGTSELVAGDSGSRPLEFMLPPGLYDVRVDTDRQVHVLRGIAIRSGERVEHRIATE